jgi:Protein of unknown function (DUF3237)
MRLEPLYRATFTTLESWSVEIEGEHGSEGQSFLIAEGRLEGRLSARLRGANFPRRRSDGTHTPSFRGALETDDGATILYAWEGYGRAARLGVSELVGSITHVTGDERYRWLNTAVCALAGKARPREDGSGLDVVLEVAEIVP